MIAGATLQLSAILYDPNNKILTDRAIVWKSSDSLKVSVSKEGKILAIASGQVTITANYFYLYKCSSAIDYCKTMK